MTIGEQQQAIKASAMEYLAAVADPRFDRTRDHPLVNVLVIALLVVLCGGASFVAMERYGCAKKDFLATFLDLEKGIPSHDTFGRVFASLDPNALQEAFRAWVASLVEVSKGEVVAIDGNTLRRSFRDAGNKASVHLVSAWAAKNRVVLGQLKTEQKSNEITAIPKLLELLKLKGATVTFDAMGCQNVIAAKIISREANYMLAVKENQPTLLAEVEAPFAATAERDDHDSVVNCAEATETGHGRTEVRRCLTSVRSFTDNTQSGLAEPCHGRYGRSRAHPARADVN